MKVTKTFSLDAKLLADVEEFLKSEGETRTIHQFVEDGMRKELSTSEKRLAKAEGEHEARQ